MTESGSLGVASDSDPLLVFRAWWEMSRTASLSKHPGAVCVSTVDERGVPEGRFVDLKELSDQGFVFGTHLRPHHWGAYCVIPARIEFLEFRASRIHVRTLFERGPTGWRRSLLQP